MRLVDGPGLLIPPTGLEKEPEGVDTVLRRRLGLLLFRELEVESESVDRDPILAREILRAAWWKRCCCSN